MEERKMNCSKCGAELLEDALFCSKCGSPVEQKLYCNKCGAELPSDAMFCHKCGTKVANTTTVASKQNNIESSQTKIGDIIEFGTYKYEVWTSADKSHSKTAPITWRVLDITNDGNLFVISEDSMEDKPFNPWDGGKRVSWEECSLRKWLNNDFLNKAFSAEEQTRILAVNVKNSIGDNGLEDTIDKVFLLSTEEVEKYFVPDDPNNKKGPSKDRQCHQFHNAESIKSFNKHTGEHEKDYPRAWRLRTTYKSGDHLAYPCAVCDDGSWKGRDDYGDLFNTHDQWFGVRPAMVIKP